MYIFPLYAFAVSLGSFLLFYSEVLFAKRILPWFGGSASVWAVSLAFFTTLLFVGYLYAYVLAKMKRGTLLVHTIILVLVGGVTIFQASSWSGLLVPYDLCCSALDTPNRSVLTALFFSIGGQFFVLSAGSVLCMTWFAHLRTTLKMEKSPHSLYAYSNVGSLVALLTFPFLFEPLFGLRIQETVWMYTFFAYLLILLVCMYLVYASRRGDQTLPLPVTNVGVAPSSVLYWMGYSALGSMLLMSTTHLISQSVTPSPFLWIIPLALYLLSFVVTFSAYPYSRTKALYGTVFGGLIATYFFVGNVPYLPFVIIVSGLYLFSALVFVHGQLYALRPTRDEQLPTFYLAISAGGALGTVFVALFAPYLFDWYAEVPLTLTVVLILALPRLRLFSPSFASLSKEQYQLITGACIGLTFLTPFLSHYLQGTGLVSFTRNFYGVSKVAQILYDGDPAVSLVNGKILHGLQLTEEVLAQTPTLYYARGSGLDTAFSIARSRHQGLRVGLVGLGSGVTASYCIPGDRFTFFEINPAIIAEAEKHFSFLKQCSDSHVVLGDGRISLQHEVGTSTSTKPYDLIVLDAFTDDAIPVSLLTTEAFALYNSALSEDGVLAIHISNTFLDLGPTVRAGLQSIAMQGVRVWGKPKSRASVASEWIIASKTMPQPDTLHKARGMTYTSIDQMDIVRPWTDDRSSILRTVILH
jgi:hypothetical protein